VGHFFSLVGEINYASLSTIDLSIASTVNDKREIEIDYIQPSIPRHLETGHKALKKRGGADILKKGPHSCISEWRVTMTDGASGDVYKRLQHLHIL